MAGRPRNSPRPAAARQTRLLPMTNAAQRAGSGLDGGAPSPDNLSSVEGSKRKLRGGYYTPKPVSEFLARWAISDPGAAVLEPSAGDGQFVAAALEHLGGLGRITAVELNEREAAKAETRGGDRTTVIRRDFFAWFAELRPDGAFDAVLGNPPFIRYQDFPEEQRARAFELLKEIGLKPTRLTNAWLPFVVLATRALRPGGRLALVLPAELLQVNYAAELREYLVRSYEELTILTFRRLLFDGIQQETILLLGVRGDAAPARIAFQELADSHDLGARMPRPAGRVDVELDHAREKWTQYYLSPYELGLIREIEASSCFSRVRDFAEIDVGIVTGRNDFFVLTAEAAKQWDLLPWCVPLVGRSAQIPGVVLHDEDWQRLAADEGRCYLLQLGDVDRESLEAGARSYVEHGEQLGVDQGYKCALRRPRWWNVPSVWVPDAFFLRQIHEGPRVVQNLSGATCTDTIYRVRMTNGVGPGWMAAASVNSLVFAFAEIRGRSYGGGVLELEPTEAEALPFPRPHLGRNPLPLTELDELIKTRGIEAALDENDRTQLGLAGLDASDTHVLRGMWRKLYERRLGRKRR